MNMTIISTAGSTNELPRLTQDRPTVSYTPIKDVEILDQDEFMAARAYWSDFKCGHNLCRYVLLSDQQCRTLVARSMYSGETMIEILAKYRFDGNFALIGTSGSGNRHIIHQNGTAHEIDD